MSKKSLSNFLKNVGNGIAKHSPEILTGIGIAGMVTSTILAVRATPKALRLIDQEIERQNKELIEEADRRQASLCPQVTELKAKDIVKVTWKCYIPAAATSVASIACLVGASTVHLKRNTMLATAYKLSETAFTEYKEKVVETLGEKKEKVIREKIGKDQVDKKPIIENEIVLTERGSTLCHDPMSDRYFKSDINDIKKAVNDINSRLLCDDYVSLNDFYSEIGLGDTRLGNTIGWNTSFCRQIKLDLHPILTKNDEPCLVLDFAIPPKYDFDKFM